MMGMPRLRRLLLPALGVWLVWAYAAHEWRGLDALGLAWRELAAPVAAPTPAGFLRAWAGRIGGLAAFAAVQAACLVAGAAALRLARLRASVFTALPAGWALTGGAAAGLALAGIAFPFPVIAVAVLPALLGPRRAARRLVPPPVVVPRAGVARLAAAVLLGALTVVAIAAQAPQTEVDPLTYHLEKPLRALAAGRFVAHPASYYDYLPPLWEALLLPLFAGGGEPAVRWFPPALLAFLAAGVGRLAGRAGWPAAALVASNPFLAGQALMAKNDLCIAAFAVALLPLCAARRPRREGAGAVVIGALAGAAFLTKYTTGGYLLPAAAAALLATGRPARRFLPPLLGAAAVVALPLLAHNWLLTRDPVYPAGHAAIASPWFPPIAAVRLREALYGITRQDPGAVSKWRNLEGLWSSGEETFLRWAALLPALLVLPVWRGLDRAALAALATLAVAWAAGPPPVRFGAAMFPIGILIAARATSALPAARPGSWRWLLPALLALQAAHVLLLPSLAAALRAGAGLEDPGAYRARRLTTFAALADVVRTAAGPGARVVLAGDSRAAALLPASARFPAYGAAAFPPYRAVAGARDLRDVTRRMRQHGWTWLAYNRLSAFFWRRSLADDPWTERELTLWARWWTTHAERVWESPVTDLQQGYFYLWRLRRAPVPAARRERAALPGLEGWIWTAEARARAGDVPGALARLAALRRAAGDFAVPDIIEAVMLRDRLHPGPRRALLLRATALGWRSPEVFADLAGYAAAAGRDAEARDWIARARTLDPALPDDALLGLMRRAGREARTAPALR